MDKNAPLNRPTSQSTIIKDITFDEFLNVIA